MKTIEEIKLAHPISEIVDRLGLANRRPKSGTYAIHCPAPDHDDTNASCVIYPNLNRFECKSCGVKGDAIDLIKLKFNFDFKEAIEWLGESLEPKNKKNHKDKYVRETYFDDHGINKEMQVRFNLYLGNFKGFPTAVIPNNKGEHHRSFSGKNKFLTIGETTLFKAGKDKNGR